MCSSSKPVQHIKLATDLMGMIIYKWLFDYRLNYISYLAYL